MTSCLYFYVTPFVLTIKIAFGGWRLAFESGVWRLGLSFSVGRSLPQICWRLASGVWRLESLCSLAQKRWRLASLLCSLPNLIR